MKLLAILLLSSACLAQSLPDAPTLQPKPQSKTAFFSFRTWQEPALKPNKKSWVFFLGSNVAPWIALSLANHQKEAWHSEAPALAAVNGLDFLAFKAMSPAMSVEGGIYGFIHYIRAQ